MITRPLLAAKITREHVEDLVFPLVVSDKLDGIRCLIHPELGPVSRAFKPIPNNFIREALDRTEFWGLDGELIVLNAKMEPLGFNDIQSGVMSKYGAPQWVYVVFDKFWDAKEGSLAEVEYGERIKEYTHTVRHSGTQMVPLVQHSISAPFSVMGAFDGALNRGYEGIILRSPFAGYKSGRSTVKQQILLKMKPEDDAEGEVVGFDELYQNNNDLEQDEFGLAKRSSKLENQVPADTLGALVLATKWGTLNIGSGFTLALRDEIWQNKESFIGRIVTFKYQSHGMKNDGMPRFPIFKGFRDPIDL